MQFSKLCVRITEIYIYFFYHIIFIQHHFMICAIIEQP